MCALLSLLLLVFAAPQLSQSPTHTDTDLQTTKKASDNGHMFKQIAIFSLSAVCVQCGLRLSLKMF